MPLLLYRYSFDQKVLCSLSQDLVCVGDLVLLYVYSVSCSSTWNICHGCLVSVCRNTAGLVFQIYKS